MFARSVPDVQFKSLLSQQCFFLDIYINKVIMNNAVSNSVLRICDMVVHGSCTVLCTVHNIGSVDFVQLVHVSVLAPCSSVFVAI